ncbi:MAG TPA: prolyl oligopeptidase family serine peptidase [Kofleriaceae bacterium]|nr:prolyl oligopeptidase family serine peptidase [Kofleriaceae bacterium]
MPARSLALCVGICLIAALQPAAAAREWTLEAALQVPQIDDVQLAPDGQHALIAVARADVAHNAFGRAYQLVDLATGALTPLPARLDRPRWSPSGAAIAWLVRGKTGAAIVISNARGGGERPLTTGARAIAGFAWSPDGTRIAAIEEAAATAAPPPRLRWLDAESDYLDSRPAKRDVYVIDVAARREVALTHDTWSYGGPATDRDPSWSADGARLAVIRQPSPRYGDFEHAQYVAIRVRDGAIEDLVGHAFFAYPHSLPPMFAPRGDAIAYARSWDGKLAARQDLYIDGRDVTAALDRDLWSCGSGAAAWQGDAVLVSLLDGVAQRLFRVEPGRDAPQPLTSPDGSVGAFSAAPGGRVAYVWSTPSQPGELFVLDPGQPARQITHLGGLADLPIATSRVVEWRAADGHMIHGQLTVPSGDARRAPMIVELHGGPQCADDSSFSGFSQFLASHGVAHFRPDPRGSDGYGDWSYKAIVGNTADGPMADDLAGIAAVLASGVGDPDRLFLEGASFGGYLATWLVTHDHRFKAAVAAVPVTDLLLDYTLSESPNITRRFYGDKPTLDAARLARDSPLSYARGNRTPLLLQIGLRDTRAPYVQTIELYKALVEAGSEVRLLADAEAGHGPDDLRGALQWQAAALAWFAAHGGPALPGAVLPK